MFAVIGGYYPRDITFVAAFDIDERKVGLPLGEAIFQQPNCARVFMPQVPAGPLVQMGQPLDGFSEHMLSEDPDRGFRLSGADPVDVVQLLKESQADVLLNFCPVGSEEATRYYAQCCIDAGVAMVNCIPVFIASDPTWERRFADAGLPIIGDDMRSQFGASVVSQVLQELALDRGAVVDFHQQINVGGNTDFNNMMVQSRLSSKKQSKENVIRAQSELRGVSIEKDSLFAGPSTFIPYLKDTKVAYFNLLLRGFGDAPISFDAKLSVCDSENSAGVVIDAIRYLKVAHELGIAGALRGPSAWTQKTPPMQMTLADAQAECAALAQRQLTATMKSGKQQA
jgi:myo-inositol-1-phosphate synthase